MKYYVHVKATSGVMVKPGSVVGVHALRADYIKLENGDALGVVERPAHNCRQLLEKMPGVTVFLHPMNPRKLPTEHVALLAHAGVVDGDSMWDAGEKLEATHVHPWFNPEFSSRPY